jgi:hypothetical protein
VLVAAVASFLRGGKYHHADDQVPAARPRPETLSELEAFPEPAAQAVAETEPFLAE